MRQDGKHTVDVDDDVRVKARVTLVAAQQFLDCNTDAFGNKRPLQIAKAADVVCIPHKDAPLTPTIQKEKAFTCITYCDNDIFTIRQYQIQEAVDIVNESYALLTILQGQGLLETKQETLDVKAGDNLIVTSLAKRYTLQGSMQVMVAIPKEKR